jgi:hypothetical protein
MQRLVHFNNPDKDFLPLSTQVHPDPRHGTMVDRCLRMKVSVQPLLPAL